MAHNFNANSCGEVAPWFLASVTSSAIADHIADAKFNYLVGFVGQTLAGVIALRDTTHVHHLFVAHEFHRQGVAARLWEQAKTDAIALGNKKSFSVRSSEYAVPVYERFGFHVVGARAEKDGVIFVPMKLELSRIGE
ncbi:MAG: GNAT family N-acetyltransferase [Gammaproteobacteria bacterium]|nr:GNAT family N-acetyltransferase [Gammaproteobacteria bacterium]